MSSTNKVIILYFDDFTGNGAFAAIKNKYSREGIACYGIKLSDNIPGQGDRKAAISHNDIQWPDNVNIDENTRILIMGHSRPGAEYFASDNARKLYPEQIAEAFRLHISPNTAKYQTSTIFAGQRQLRLPVL